MHARRRLSLGLALFAAGCTASGPTADEIGRASQAIINGVLSTAQDDSTILIPLFKNGQFTGTCSGSLIAANLVLTARHCVSTTDSESECDSSGNALMGGNIYSDRAAADIGVIVGTSIKFELDASGKQVFITDTSYLCNQDIAFVLLDKALTAQPIAQLRSASPPLMGEKIRAVGWGVSNNSDGFTRRRRDDIPILEVGPFDYPNSLGGLGSNELEVGESICSGDSGGPAISETTGAVVGVVSRGGNGKMVNPNTDPQYTGCVDGGAFVTKNLYTRVDGFPDLLNQAFAAAGTDPWVEGGPDPRKAKTGEACTSSDACRSVICVDSTATGYCSQTCDGTPDSCVAPMVCAKDGTLQICKIPPPAKKGGCEIGGGGVASPWLALLLLLSAVAVRARFRRRIEHAIT